MCGRLFPAPRGVSSSEQLENRVGVVATYGRRESRHGIRKNGKLQMVEFVFWGICGWRKTGVF